MTRYPTFASEVERLQDIVDETELANRSLKKHVRVLLDALSLLPPPMHPLSSLSFNPPPPPPSPHLHMHPSAVDVGVPTRI